MANERHSGFCYGVRSVPQSQQSESAVPSDGNGVPKSAILYEDRATNSMENAVYSAKAAKDAGIKEKCAIICCQAFHARRAFLSYACHFDGAGLMAVPNVTQGVAKDD